jgi:hypothetical protein
MSDGTGPGAVAGSQGLLPPFADTPTPVVILSDPCQHFGVAPSAASRRLPRRGRWQGAGRSGSVRGHGHGPDALLLDAPLRHPLRASEVPRRGTISSASSPASRRPSRMPLNRRYRARMPPSSPRTWPSAARRASRRVPTRAGVAGARGLRLRPDLAALAASLRSTAGL